MILDPLITAIFYADLILITLLSGLIIYISGERGAKQDREVFLLYREERKVA